MPIQTATEADHTSGVTPPDAVWRVKAFTILPSYRLAVTFRDGTNGIVDLSAVTTALKRGIYGALKDRAYFEQARLELGVVTWPNGADLDPAWMYEQIKQMKTRVCPLMSLI